MPATDLNAVNVFAKVVELRSFRAAAIALGIPRSTVSSKVAQLEEHLQVRLLERTTRTVRITDAGSAYYRKVTPALEALQAAERTIDELQMEPAGPLRLTATLDGGQFILAPVLIEYMRQYPKVQLDLHLTDRRVDLIEEGVDLALRMGHLPDSSMVARKLSTPGVLGVYASPDYLALHPEPRRPQALETHDCLVMSSHPDPTTWSFQSRGTTIRVPVRARATANSFLVLRDMAKAGLGIARLPDFIAAPGVGEGQLRPVLLSYLPPPVPWSAIISSSRYLSPKLRRLIDLLEQHYRPDDRLKKTEGGRPAGGKRGRGIAYHCVSSAQRGGSPGGGQ